MKTTRVFYSFDVDKQLESSQPISIGVVATTQHKTQVTVSNFIKYLKHALDSDEVKDINTDVEVNDYLSKYYSCKTKFVGTGNYCNVFINTYTVGNYLINCQVQDYSHHVVLSSMEIYHVIDTIDCFYGQFDNNTGTNNTTEENLNFNLSLYKNLSIYEGPVYMVAHNFKSWISKFENVEIWSDINHLNKHLFMDMLKLYNNESNIDKDSTLPMNITRESFYDINTLMKYKDINISKEDINTENIEDDNKSIPLYDAYMNYKLYELINE